MAAKLAYQLYSVRHPSEADSRLFSSGLFAWVEAFARYGREAIMSADIKKENLENYDVIHVNYTPTNETYITALRNELGEHSDTKIVANVDFGKMMWNSTDPLVMKDQLSRADLVFHVESTGAKTLERLLGRKVYTIPHPTNVEDLKKGFTAERSPVITCQYHRYSDTWTDYYYGLMNIKKEYDVSTALLNYEAPKGERGPKVPIICMFNKLVMKLPYATYIDLYLRHSLVNVDITYDYTFGRGEIDAAALKIPTIGSYTIEAQRNLWPELAVTPGKEWELEERMRTILDNDEFREEMAQQGYERCEAYSLKSSYEKIVTALEEEKLL
jgi:glycosyltransferase involved in cell wall biosynthesis